MTDIINHMIDLQEKSFATTRSSLVAGSAIVCSKAHEQLQTPNSIIVQHYMWDILGGDDRFSP